MVEDKDKTGLTEVREAIDANDHPALADDPTHQDGKTDVALDESFPASDPPAQPVGSGEPVPSSGFNEEAERAILARRTRIQERAHAHWETEGRPEGRDLDHWLRAEAEEPDEGVG